MGFLSLWFGFSRPVTREAYLASGLGLALVKYLGEAGLVTAWTGRTYTPLQSLSPLYSVRAEALTQAAPELGWILAFWSLPFLWIALSMSVRRAVSAGFSPSLGFALLIPFLNYAAMLFLAVMPNLVKTLPRLEDLPESMQGLREQLNWKSYPIAIMSGLALQTVVMLLSVYAFQSYGWMLFFGGPIISSALTGYLLNVPQRNRVGSTMMAALFMQFCFASALLLFALEGLICIAMAVPLVVPLGLIGGLLGYLLATLQVNERETGATLLLLLPLGFSTTAWQEPPLVPVVTQIEIAAPPEVVWNSVVAFPELPPPEEWEFRAGIACPMSARIDGHGIGAIRHCIFTTGEFVEPITVWDAPQRLAFDVTRQPEPMFELTPYRAVHPPHLHGTFRSERGEFLLQPGPDGGTILIGTTWYRLDMQPLEYWSPLSEFLIHRIHNRVLRHVKKCAEEEVRRAAGTLVSP